MLDGFKKFIARGNAIDLAVAVVIGAAFNNVVSSLVKGLVTPLIGLFGGNPDFSSFYFQIGGSKFLVGDFLGSLISFLIVSAVIYFFVVVPLNKFVPKNPGEKSCPQCLSQIPLKAKRCKFCTSIVK